MRTWFHVDTDGLEAIYRGHGRTFTGDGARFTRSAIDASLALFDACGVKATYFVIAEELDDAEKRAGFEEIVRAGHEIAGHGLRHRYLNRIDSAAKREEIVDGKAKIEDVLGASVQGFRAPGYSIDLESLELLAEAGYRYDSSVFPTFAFRERLGLQRLLREPFEILPNSGLVEVPMPSPGPFLPSFHPSYAFYLRRPYVRWCLRSLAKRQRNLTFLFHFADFAAPHDAVTGLRMNVFTENWFSQETKQAFLRALVDDVREHYTPTTTEAFLADWPAQAPELRPRTVLGVSTTHETGACVVRDGEILSALSEERISRFKLDNRYPPKGSIREAIRLAGIEPSEIEAVAVAGLEWRDLLPQTLHAFWEDVRDFHGWNDYFPHFCRSLYRLFYFFRATGYDEVSAFLREEYGIDPPVSFVEHHHAHGASAFRTGEVEDALVITADGVGDDVCISFSEARGREIRRLERFFYPNSFGQFYTACTQALGFKAGRHEGKITGLSGYGEPNPELIRKIESTFMDEGGFKLDKRFYAEGFPRFKKSTFRDLFAGKLHLFSFEYRNYKKPLARLIEGHSREEVAHAFQLLLEREMTRLVRRHWEGDLPRNLAIAGGIFANVKLNMVLSQELEPESIYIFPAMGDAGLCVGAALEIAAEPPRVAPTMYLGTGYEADEITQAIEADGALEVEEPGDMAARAAELLADGKIVARFAGRMEFGPRALGNRSILYHCADPSVNQWLNTQLERTEFMPFAPMCLYEDAEEYFVLREGEKRACEFMDAGDRLHRSDEGDVPGRGSRRRHRAPAAGARRPQPGHARHPARVQGPNGRSLHDQHQLQHARRADRADAGGGDHGLSPEPSRLPDPRPLHRSRGRGCSGARSRRWAGRVVCQRRGDGRQEREEGRVKQPAVAVVGAGYWGKNLVRNFGQLRALAAICDADAEQLARIGEGQPEARRYTAFEQVLEDPDIEAVVLATPAVRHYEQARAAMEAGKDVFVEKPLALREEDGRALVELAAARDRILMVGHILEYHPAVAVLRDLVERGELGDLRYLYSNRLNLGKVRTEENILWSFAPHDISVMLRLVGAEPESVTASGAQYLQTGVADVTVSNLRFPGGARGHIFVSWLHPYKEQRLVVVGERKMAVFDDTAREGKLKLYDKGIEWVSGHPVPRQTAETTLFFDESEPLRLECQHFLDAVRERHSPLTDGASGLRVLRVLSACQRSLEQDGAPVALESDA